MLFCKAAAQLAPGGVYESDSHGDHTREYLTLQTGVLTLEESGREWTLHQSECLRFASDRPHVYRNPGSEPAVCMSFFLAG